MKKQDFLLFLVGVVFCAAIIGCANNQLWFSEKDISMVDSTPDGLTAFLGPPFLKKNVEMRPGPMRGAEYLYYFVGRSGNIEFRKYAYHNTKWVTTAHPLPEESRDTKYRVLDINNSKDRKKLSQYLHRNQTPCTKANGGR